MDDKYAILACGIIALLFLGAIIYYILLFSLVRKLKVCDPRLWERCRKMARVLEPNMSTAYKIVMRSKEGSDLRISDKSIKLIKAIKVNLYAIMTLFMLVLFVGLYFSVNKS